MAAVLEIQNNRENDDCSNVNTYTDVLILCIMNAVKNKAILEKRVPYSQRYLVLGLVGLAGLVGVSRGSVTLTVTVRVSSVSVMVHHHHHHHHHHENF